MSDNKFILNVKAGSDNGNSEHDMIINNYLVTQPNVFAVLKKLPLLDEINPLAIIPRLEDNLIVTVNSRSCPPGIYYVGKQAINSGNRIHNMEVGLMNDKANSDIVIVNPLAQIAAFAVKKAFNETGALKTEIVVHADLVTALPVTQYSKEIAELLADRYMIKGEKHSVTVHVGDSRVNVDIYIEFCKVLPESVPVVFYLQTATSDVFDSLDKLYNKDADGKAVKDKTVFGGKYFEGKRILHIAIGEGTTEYPITEGIVFNPDFIRGSDNGVGLAIEAALDSFKSAVGLRTYTRQNYSSVLRDPGHKYYEKAMECVEEYLDFEASEILKIAKQEIEKANNEVDIICVHGGGSILMREHLENKLLALCKRANIVLFYVGENHAVTLESKGMYCFAKSDIFKKLKKKLTGKETLEIIEEKENTNEGLKGAIKKEVTESSKIEQV